jgi:hypothetical protein
MSTEDLILFTDEVCARRPNDFVRWYLDNVKRGPDYYEPREPETDRDKLLLGDLAWAVLLEGRPSSTAAQSLLKIVPFDISGIPTASLELLDSHDLEAIAAVIRKVIDGTSGIKASIATKMLHPKRRATVPVCDNDAIFGSFLQPGWRPGDTATGRKDTVLAALEAIHHCLTRPENRSAWDCLQKAYPRYQLVELFDMTWWTVLRKGTDLIESDGCYELCAGA